MTDQKKKLILTLLKSKVVQHLDELNIQQLCGVVKYIDDIKTQQNINTLKLINNHSINKPIKNLLCQVDSEHVRKPITDSPTGQKSGRIPLV